MLQIQEKHCSTEKLTALAIPIVSLCHRYHVPCIINDDVQAAKDSGADGVHVGQDDTSIAQARAVLGAGKWIGTSAHNVAEARKAQQDGADYIGTGQCLARQRNRMQRRFRCKCYRKSVRQSPFQSLPLAALQQKMLCSCVVGGQGIAVISAIFAKPDCTAAAKEMRQLADAICKGAGA